MIEIDNRFQNIMKGELLLIPMLVFFNNPGPKILFNLFLNINFRSISINIILVFMLHILPLFMTLFIFYKFSRFLKYNRPDFMKFYKNKVNTYYLLVFLSVLELALTHSLMDDNHYFVIFSYENRAKKSIIFMHIYTSNMLIFNLVYSIFFEGHLIIKNIRHNTRIRGIFFSLKRKMYDLALYLIYVSFIFVVTYKYINFVNKLTMINADIRLDSFHYTIRTTFMIMIVIYFILF